MPAAAEGLRLGQCASGSWMSALAEELRQASGIELAIACAHGTRSAATFTADGIRYFHVPGSDGPFANDSAILHRCVSIVRSWKPDIIHIHGSERCYGLMSARGLIDTPTVISVQGLLSACSRWDGFFGTASFSSVLRMHRPIEPLVGRGLFWYYAALRAKAAREREILRGNKYFLGRTAWDRAQVRAANRNADYMHVGELIRSPFWHRSWTLDHARPYRVFLTAPGHPRKGLEVLLDAAATIRSDYPDIEIYVAGDISRRSGFGRYLWRRIRKSPVPVQTPGYLDSAALAEALCSAHVFVLPSFMENSPNSLCEAMLAGVPCIASYVGGTPSLLIDRETGVFVPPGDPIILGDSIRRIFEDRSEAVRLGRNAAMAARRRHDPGTVMGQLLAAYTRVLQGANSGNAIACT